MELRQQVESVMVVVVTEMVEMDCLAVDCLAVIVQVVV